MGKIEIRQVKPEHSRSLLTQRPHQVQSSPCWVGFLKDRSGENDSSVIIYHDGRPAGYVPALQYRDLIQSLPYPVSYAGPVFDGAVSEFPVGKLLVKLCDYYCTYVMVNVSSCEVASTERHSAYVK
jgi:hypothetical protein